MKNLFYLVTMVLVFTACQTECEPTVFGEKEVSVTVRADEVMSRVANASAAEKQITSITVVAYAKDGSYIEAKTGSAGGAYKFTAIDETKFPVKIFAIANVGSIWTSSITAWSTSKYSDIASLVISQAGSNSVLNDGVTPLLMYGETTVAPGVDSGTVDLKRPMARVSIKNSSTFTFNEISFTGLYKSVKVDGTLSIPNCTYKKSGSFAPSSTAIDLYFMPTTGATKPVITVKNGSTTKTAELNHFVANKVHPITINNNSIGIDIEITVPPTWEEDGNQPIQ